MLECETLCSLQSQIPSKLENQSENNKTLTQLKLDGKLNSVTGGNLQNNVKRKRSKKSRTKAFLVHSTCQVLTGVLPTITNVTIDPSSPRKKTNCIEHESSLQPSYFYWAEVHKCIEKSSNCKYIKDKKMLTCDFSNCLFSTSTNHHYKKHILAHIEKRSHQCHVCGLGFNERWRMERHLATHNNSIIDKCSITQSDCVINNNNKPINNKVDMCNENSSYVMMFDELLSDDEYFDDSS